MSRVREYFYVPHGPNAECNECLVYRRFSDDSNGIELVGMWKHSDSAKKVVELLNSFERAGIGPSVVVEQIRAAISPVHSTRKAINIATRVAELLGVDYAESTPDQIIKQLVDNWYVAPTGEVKNES